MILQNRIIASQFHVKMEAFATIPQLDIHATARMITLGTTAIVSIIAVMYIEKNIYFYSLLRILNLARPVVILLEQIRQAHNIK